MDVIFGLDLGNGIGWYHNRGSLIDTGVFVFSYVSVFPFLWPLAVHYYVDPCLGRWGLNTLSPCFAFRACLVEVSHVSAAVTRLGLPVIRDQNTVPRNCQIGRYMLIKSDVYDTYAICYCVTVNI